MFFRFPTCFRYEEDAFHVKHRLALSQMVLPKLTAEDFKHGVGCAIKAVPHANIARTPQALISIWAVETIPVEDQCQPRLSTVGASLISENNRQN
jgi:hypothetical protein